MHKDAAYGSCCLRQLVTDAHNAGLACLLKRTSNAIKFASLDYQKPSQVSVKFLGSLLVCLSLQSIPNDNDGQLESSLRLQLHISCLPEVLLVPVNLRSEKG